MTNPYPGLPVLYRLRPGQTRMGQQDLAALVTRVAADGRLDLIAFPPRTAIADALVLENVAPMSQDITGNCWHLPDSGADEVAGLRARVDELEQLVDDLTKPAPGPKPGPAAPVIDKQMLTAAKADIEAIALQQVPGQVAFVKRATKQPVQAEA